ncbi:SMK killer toxin resistance protein [Purpureocillium takamizusanense]|uniref:SMK killer toxin resistance protein n=1 Tax=Purpureocillium takamizusanense TaxID=2060973 RepID=A0A9Q8VDM7_9HYPO|nr:SMK killer toxin resistance protein [Purpureocillium takamizusanense]UNI21049.1 SMK killer toxin resistance protein [Purpureocillium takamizusanense]
MASSFVTDLWESIFTPGPTPPLLRAANASFAALQLVLAAMLYATGSLHCVVLSVLCAGLWWAVNWFAAELAVVQREQKRRQDDEGEKKEKKKDGDKDKRWRGGGGGSNDDRTDRKRDAGAGGVDDSSDTEVETGRARTRGGTKAAASAAAASPRRDQQTSAELRQRVPAPVAGGVSPSGTQSSASTEDEWEKVSGSEREGKSQDE